MQRPRKGAGMPDRSTLLYTQDAILDILRDSVSQGDRAGLTELFESSQPVDIASAANSLEDEELQSLVDLLPSSSIESLVSDADEELAMRIAGMLDDRSLLIVVGRMRDDDAADVLGSLPRERVSRLLSEMREADRTVLLSLLQYPDESAGSIMTTSFLALRQDRTVSDCLALIRAKGAGTEQIQIVYVLGMYGELAGCVDLRTILSSSRNTTLAMIMERHVISVDPYDDQEEAATLVARYDLAVLPVVSGGQLLGVITVDDIIDVIIEEYDEDLLRLAGANAEERLDTPFLRSVRMRLPWLLVNLVTAFLASAVVRMFEGTIAQAVALSAIMTIVSGMGGNAGSQTMAIVVRAIAREDVPKAGVLAGLAKEAITGAIDGLAVGLVTGVVVAAVYGNLYLSLVVLAAMVGNMVIAGTSGLLVPVVLKACHQDPAVSSSIFVTTATDVLGFLLFLGLAQLFLPLIV